MALARHQLASGSARAVLVNSGQANAATGERGSEDAFVATAGAAAVLGVNVDRRRAVLDRRDRRADPHGRARSPHCPPPRAALDDDGGDEFAHAIMTTDTVDKQARREVGDHRLGGCAKGVGMIAPNLATMLVFITTDAAVAPDDLQRLADEQLKPRFNALTVDGCTVDERHRPAARERRRGRGAGRPRFRDVGRVRRGRGRRSRRPCRAS